LTLKNGKDYVESPRGLKLNFYAFGEKIENVVENSLFRRYINAADCSYEGAPTLSGAYLMI